MFFLWDSEGGFNGVLLLVNKIVTTKSMEYSFLPKSSVLTARYIHRRPGYRAYWYDVTIEHTATKVVVV